MTGTVVVTDPGLTAGYDLHLNDLTAKFYQTGASTPIVQLIMDGSWATRGTSDALSLDQNYNFVLTVNGERASLANDLTVSFTSGGNPISAGVPLPDGTININGAWRVSSARENHALELTTITPLVYDDACGGIVAGVLDARGTGGNVRVTWTACGTHTDVYLPAKLTPAHATRPGWDSLPAGPSYSAPAPLPRFAPAAPLPRCPAAPPRPAIPSRRSTPAPHPRSSCPPPRPQSW